MHSADNQVPARLGLVVMEHRVEAGRLVDDAYQRGRLLDVELGRQLGEVGLGGRLDAIGPAAEEDGVEVHRENLVFGVAALQLDGGGPFAELDPDHLEFAAHLLTGVEGLGKLLGDGTSSSLAGIPHQHGTEENARKTGEIDSAVGVETRVLGGDRRVDYVGRDVLVLHVGAVFDVEGADDLSVRGDELGGEIVVRMFELGEGWDVGAEPYCRKQPNHREYREKEQAPEPDYYLLACTIFHDRRKNTD